MTPARRLEQALHRAALARGGFTRKFTSPGRRGVPDRIVFLPGGRVLFVEVKAPGDRLSPHQRNEFAEMANVGTEVRILTAKEEIEDMLK